ncbi:hypothetical protein [Winogradskya humida]|uniref:Uncharacterized protein n=1 Tax=Winogradskya humida TaxID=113566 RepID=A0ABQ4A8V6_9ACTN|nr:hypothetical protein [Actinoplanes humidus]GIE26767.1 hypothetical protein Ahu01nite_098690 [Actinoplanes humidus]
MPVCLGDLPAADCDQDVSVFAALPEIEQLAWPDDVVKQWLYDHGRHLEFLDDYGSLDLSQIRWTLQRVVVDDLAAAPTGPSDQDWLEQVAAEHRYWLSRRPQRYREAWENQGSWLLPPILITRDLIHPGSPGLQVVEGRMRMGILKGRRADGLHVADTHQAWVGSASTSAKPGTQPWAAE